MNISKTWLIIKIGEKEYAINYKYVLAVTELKHTNYLSESSRPFIRGIYDIFNSELPVLDGYKIVQETSKSKTKLDFCKQITEIKIDYIAWMDCLDSVAINFEIDNSSMKKLEEKLSNYASSKSDYGDTYLNKLETKIKENIVMQMLRSKRIHPDCKIADNMLEIDEIRKSSERYILDSLDNLIEAYTSKLSEMCIVLSVKESNFGLTIDSLEMVADVTEEDSLLKKKGSSFSAAVVDIKGNKYNVMDLTKLKNILN